MIAATTMAPTATCITTTDPGGSSAALVTPSINTFITELSWHTITKNKNNWQP